MYSFNGGNLRAVIPKQLRQNFLSVFHSARQGVDNILRRARQTAYWPGMDNEV